MPIEIKELHIKINVASDSQSNASKDKQSGGKDESMMEDFIEGVIEIQKRKNER